MAWHKQHMRFLGHSVLFLWLLAFGCAGSNQAESAYFQIKVQATGVPQTATTLEPQVFVLDTKWVAAQPISPEDLTKLTKRDPVSVLLRVQVGDAGERVAVSLRLEDEKKQLVAVGGNQIALARDFLLPVALIDVSDARHKELQVSKATPSTVVSGRTTTLYGWGFSPTAKTSIAGIAANEVQWMSSVELLVKVPDGIPQGPLSVKIDNLDGRSDERSDLLIGQ